jgi:sensor histidine kinase YesM
MITTYKYLFRNFFIKKSQKMFILFYEKISENMHFIIKLDFFRNNKSDSWEMHDLYTTDKACIECTF